MSDLESTRLSWNVATRNHNAHKGDQARFLREGGDVLFAEELALLGDVRGRRLAHLQCNAGQDTLCLARRGAIATGIDLSDEAITFARKLSVDSGIAANFERSDVVAWMDRTDERFEIVFSSYGAVGWLPDIAAWARGIERILSPGGRFVYVEFHPLVWSLDGTSLSKDDYFETRPFRSPVSDYVKESGTGLGAIELGPTVENTISATSYQYPVSTIITALARAGLRLERFEEYPHCNGCKLNTSLELDADRRWKFPDGHTRVPMMFGIEFSKSAG